MKFRYRFLFAVTIFFVIANILIFIYRNSGFEYTKFSVSKELYPSDPDSSFLKKWNSYNNRFSTEELSQGLALLSQAIGIDTILTEESKVLRITGWLYHSFQKQIGVPDNTMAGQSPLQQYLYLSSHKEKQLWCGNFQALVGFFCTVAKLSNRYVEIASLSSIPNTHEVNEVYLTGLKKWVIVDATRNRFLINKNDQLISAAEYFDFKLQKKPGELFFVGVDSGSGYSLHRYKDIYQADKYFDKDHFLRFYYTLNLSSVYAFWPKTKRYFLADPWYEIYSPGIHNSNFLFRIKQFFLFGIGAIVIVFIRLKRKKLKNVESK